MDTIITCKYRQKGKDPLQNVLHSHNEVEELLFVQSGSGVLTVGDRIYPLLPNCMYWIGRNVLHYSAPEKQEEYVRSVVSISSTFAVQLGALSGDDALMARMREECCISLDYESAKHVNALLDEMRSGERRAGVRAFLELLSVAEQKGRRIPMSDHKIAAVIAYVNQNIGEELRLDAIAAKFFIGKYYLCHLFKSVTGMRLSQYILLQRLTLCKNLLVTTDRSISEIATACGFSTFSYFCRTFAKSEGMSAREYRKRFTKK
ncbi:MAG: helix-turn-helix domain-containing protein [Clostridia bacterium]|nr:helix-turn-helix domain-containing protein [Clostridia bacterium]